MIPTFFGGFVPLWVVMSAGESEFLVILATPDLWSSADVMAGGHLVLPGRSMCLRHAIAFDMLFMVAIKNSCVLSSERRSVSRTSWIF